MALTSPPKTISAKLLFTLSFVYVAAPLLLYALRYPLAAPAYLFAGDAFYYLDIAHRSLNFHGFTFDGQYMTNGFHPLWEYCLTTLAKLEIVDFSHPAAALLPVYYTNLLILALGSAVFCVASARYLERRVLALATVAPGLLWFLVALVDANSCSTWSYLNGMESALALLCFACAFVIHREAKMSATRTMLFAALLGLGTLSRLDDVFLAIAMASIVLIKSEPSHRGRTFPYLLPLPLLLTAYLAYNHHSLGIFLPISGGAKAGFALFKNLKWSVSLFLPVLTGDGPAALLPGPAHYYGFGERSVRLVQMLAPMLICIAELAFSRRRSSLIHAAALGVILKGLYNLAFVELWYQGVWYYTVSIAVANLILVLWIDRFLAGRAFRIPLPLTLAVHALCVLFAFNIFISKRNFDGPANKVSLLANNLPLRARLDAAGVSRFIEFDDGFLSYASDLPALAGLGLALDPEAQRAIHTGQFLPLAQRRGYRILVANGAYAAVVDNAIGAGVPAPVSEIRASEFTHYTLKPLGGDGANDGLSFYEIVPR